MRAARPEGFDVSSRLVSSHCLARPGGPGWLAGWPAGREVSRKELVAAIGQQAVSAGPRSLAAAGTGSPSQPRVAWLTAKIAMILSG